MPSGSHTILYEKIKYEIETLTMPSESRIFTYGRDLDLLQRREGHVPFFLKGWNLDNIERIWYHYEVVTLIISSRSHTITHRQTTRKTSKSRTTLLQVWIFVETLAMPRGSSIVEKSRSWSCWGDHALLWNVRPIGISFDSVLISMNACMKFNSFDSC